MSKQEAPPSYDNTQEYSQAPPSYPQQQPGYAPQGVYAPQGYAPQVYTQPGYYGQPVQQTVVVTAVNPALQGDIPDDHCTYSILNTIFCCFWIGIFAIIKSQAVRDSVARGDRAGAQRNSEEALRLNKVALGVGIGINVLYITCIVLYAIFLAGAFY